MPSLPLFYHNFRVGEALVDHDLLDLPSDLVWKPMLPSALRRSLTRSDLVLAAIRDDETVLPRCRPYTQIERNRHRVTLYLHHLPLRPELLALVSRLFSSTDPKLQEDLIDAIRLTTSTIAPVSYLDGCRNNVCLANLRELQR